MNGMNYDMNENDMLNYAYISDEEDIYYNPNEIDPTMIYYVKSNQQPVMHDDMDNHHTHMPHPHHHDHPNNQHQKMKHQSEAQNQENNPNTGDMPSGNVNNDLYDRLTNRLDRGYERSKTFYEKNKNVILFIIFLVILYVLYSCGVFDGFFGPNNGSGKTRIVTRNVMDNNELDLETLRVPKEIRRIFR